MENARNIFSNVPAELAEELIETLVAADQVRVERIVSHGHVSPKGFWYDQDQDEFVILLQGAARLRFDGDELAVEMQSGDFIEIPAHRRHQVEWTTPDEPTVWLAVHYG